MLVARIAPRDVVTILHQMTSSYTNYLQWTLAALYGSSSWLFGYSHFDGNFLWCFILVCQWLQWDKEG